MRGRETSIRGYKRGEEDLKNSLFSIRKRETCVREFRYESVGMIKLVCECIW